MAIRSKNTEEQQNKKTLWPVRKKERAQRSHAEAAREREEAGLDWEEWATAADDGEAGRMSCHWAVKLLVWAIYIIGVCYAGRGIVIMAVQRKMAQGANYLFWGGVFALGAMIWLVYTAGKSYDRAAVRLLWIDRVYLELYFAVVVLGITISAMLMSNRAIAGFGAAPVAEFARGEISGLTLLGMYIPLSLFSSLTGSFVLSVVRRQRAGVLYRYTLVRLLVRSMWASLKTLSPHTMASRVVLGCTVLGLGELGVAALSVLLFLELGLLGIVVSLLLLVFYNVWLQGRVLRYVREYERIEEDIRRIGQGELTHRVAPGFRAFSGLVGGINDIAKGLETALGERMKAERLRTELITNVSHDLRTPLTGAMTYVELLKKEGMNGPRANEYLAVIDKKLYRLKVLTDDLFEAAKAASGTLPVELARIDLQELLSQGLAEMEDRVEKSAVTVHTQFPPERVAVKADGMRLWRAVSNLIDNALKYSLENTRVYIEVGRRGEDRASLTVKNISREVIADPAALAQRFVRGDASRTREGSGLGLSISQSLCELMGGELRLSADGDLFKAEILLPVWREEESAPAAQPA